MLFGYLDQAKLNGHFVGYNAEPEQLYDGNTMRTYNFCKESIDIIFPGHLDRIHELIFIDKDICGNPRQQISFWNIDYKPISQDVYDGLKNGRDDMECTR